MGKIKIQIWQLDSKGRERIEDVHIFDNRQSAIEYLESIQAEIKPYKMKKNKKYYGWESLSPILK